MRSSQDIARRSRAMVLGAVALVAVIPACTNGNTGRQSTTATASSALPSTSATPATSIPGTSVIDRAGGTFTDAASGVTVEVPAGALAHPAAVTVKPTAPDPALADQVDLVGPFVDINVAGALTAPVTVRLPLPDPLPPAGTPAGLDPSTTMVVLHFTQGTWVVVPATFDLQARTVTFQTSTFSQFGLGQLLTAAATTIVQAAITNLTSGVISFVTAPNCGTGVNDAASWGSTPVNTPVVWCAVLHADGTRLVQIANRRRYGLTVTVSGPGSVISNGTGISAEISGLAGNSRLVAIGPGETATIGIPAGATGTVVRYGYDGISQLLTGLYTAADVIVAMAKRFPALALASSAPELLHLVDITTCVRSAGIDIIKTIMSPAALASMMITCLGPALEKVITTGAAKIGLKLVVSTINAVLTLLSFAISSGAATFDLLTGQASGSLRLRASAPPPSAISTTTIPPVPPPPPPTGPVITSVSAIHAATGSDITISGSGFGDQAPFNGDLPCFVFEDVTANWFAGYIQPSGAASGALAACASPQGPFGDIVTVAIDSWTNTRIHISALTGSYLGGIYVLQAGENISIRVVNAQTGQGPASKTVAVVP
jgi:hypothetical protein